MMRGFDSFTPYVNGGMYYSDWTFWLMAAGRIVVFVGIIWLIVWAIKRFTGSNHTNFTSGDDEALSIVRERYARGEISKEEYDALVKDLSYSSRRR